jgi:hypothetical protein
VKRPSGMIASRILLVAGSLPVTEACLRLVSFISPRAEDVLGRGITNVVPDPPLGCVETYWARPLDPSLAVTPGEYAGRRGQLVWLPPGQ